MFAYQESRQATSQLTTLHSYIWNDFTAKLLFTLVECTGTGDLRMKQFHSKMFVYFVSSESRLGVDMMSKNTSLDSL